MATALLIGTNVSAAPFSGKTAKELQAAIYAIMNDANVDGGTIEFKYQLDINSMATSKNHIKITISKGEKEKC